MQRARICTNLEVVVLLENLGEGATCAQVGLSRRVRFPNQLVRQDSIASQMNAVTVTELILRDRTWFSVGC